MPSPPPTVLVEAVIGDRRWPTVPLAHGETPAAAACRAVGRPVRLVAPRSADLVDGELVLSLQVSPDDGAGPPLPPDLDLPPGTPRFRRLAAYALVVDAGRVLLTQLAEATPAPGTWTLPGGGIDPGESPVAAAVREVHEETGHRLVAPRLVDVDSWHFAGRSPSGRLENFHGIGITFVAGVREVHEPTVLDVGGSTSAAAWVPLHELAGLPLGRVRPRLERVLGLALPP